MIGSCKYSNPAYGGDGCKAGFVILSYFVFVRHKVKEGILCFTVSCVSVLLRSK